MFSQHVEAALKEWYGQGNNTGEERQQTDLGTKPQRDILWAALLFMLTTVFGGGEGEKVGVDDGRMRMWAMRSMPMFKGRMQMEGR